MIQSQFVELTTLHAELSALVAPARDRTLVLLEEERRQHPHLCIFGPVRLARQTARDRPSRGHEPEQFDR